MVRWISEPSICMNFQITLNQLEASWMQSTSTATLPTCSDGEHHRKLHCSQFNSLVLPQRAEEPQFEHRTFKVKMQYPVESAGFLENTNVNLSHKFYTSCWGQFDHPG